MPGNKKPRKAHRPHKPLAGIMAQAAKQLAFRESQKTGGLISADDVFAMLQATPGIRTAPGLIAESIDYRAKRASTERLHPTDVQRMVLMANTAIDAISKGKGDADAHDNLATACNMAMVLAEYGLGHEHLPAILDAQQALIRLRERGDRGAWGIDGPGLQAARTMIEVYEAQLADEWMTVGHLFRATDVIVQRMESGEVHTLKEAACQP